MSDTVIVALISAGASMLVSITALLLNYRGFASIDSRFGSLERRVESLDSDIKTLVGAVNDLDNRLTRVEIKLGIQP